MEEGEKGGRIWLEVGECTDLGSDLERHDLSHHDPLHGSQADGEAHHVEQHRAHADR